MNEKKKNQKALFMALKRVQRSDPDGSRAFQEK